MAEELKRLRGQGVLAKVSELDQGIKVYDFGLPAHAASLKALGLRREQAPAVGVVELSGKGLPTRTLHIEHYSDVPGGLSDLGAFLGVPMQAATAGDVRVDKVLFIVGHPSKEQAGSFYEVQGKLTAIIGERPPLGVKPRLQKVESFEGVQGPALVLLQTEGNRVLFSDGGFTNGEAMIARLYETLGQVYQPPTQYQNPQDGSILRRIPGGVYRIGREDGEANEKPVHLVEMGPFYMSKFEVTNEQYGRFVEATQYVTGAERSGGSYLPQGSKYKLVKGADWKHPNGPDSSFRPDFPVVHVNHDDALAYAVWAGLNLPFEEQWEWAACGPDSRPFPWGKDFDASNCRNSVGKGFAGTEGPSAVGSFPKDQSNFGCFDMAGNVNEWMGNYYKVYPGSSAPRDKATELYVTVKGGSWANELPQEFRVSKRIPLERTMSFSNLGFRVVRIERRRLNGN